MHDTGPQDANVVLQTMGTRHVSKTRKDVHQISDGRQNLHLVWHCASQSTVSGVSEVPLVLTVVTKPYDVLLANAVLDAPREYRENQQGLYRSNPR